nr:unnamed protein product [Spirometra erinaceieuropaei]
MNNDRLLKQLFYGDVFIGGGRKGGQIVATRTLRRPRSSVCISTQEPDRTPHRIDRCGPVMETEAAIFEANVVAVAKAKSENRRTQVLRNNDTSTHILSSCPHCRRTFRAQIGLVEHLRTQCNVDTRDSSLISLHTTTSSTSEETLTDLLNTVTTASTTNNVDSIPTCHHCNRTSHSA